MRNKGFSLIEVCVAIALVGIMIGVGVPKVKRYMATAKNVKAISTLNNLRTASELYYGENGEAPKLNSDTDAQALTKLDSYLDKKTKDSIKDGKLDVGGSADANKLNATYGGKVEITFQNPNSGGSSDGTNIWIKPVDGTKDYDLKGKKWIEY